MTNGYGGGKATPGLHGNGLGTVSLGGQSLTPGASASVALSGQLQFQIQVVNQGQNTETTIEAGEAATYTVPSVDREWMARPAGAAAFASALDANFLDNITGGLLTHSCIPAPVEEPAE